MLLCAGCVGLGDDECLCWCWANVSGDEIWIWVHRARGLPTRHRSLLVILMGRWLNGPVGLKFVWACYDGLLA